MVDKCKSRYDGPLLPTRSRCRKDNGHEGPHTCNVWSKKPPYSLSGTLEWDGTMFGTFKPVNTYTQHKPNPHNPDAPKPFIRRINKGEVEGRTQQEVKAVMLRLKNQDTPMLESFQ